MAEEPTRRGALLELLLIHKGVLVTAVQVGGSLGCSDHNMVDFSIAKERSRTISKTSTTDFKRANSVLFKLLLGSITWARALEGREPQESWLIFKHYLLQSQDRCIPSNRPTKQVKEAGDLHG